MTDAIAWMQKPENLEKATEIARKHMSLGDIQNAEQIFKELIKSQVGTYGVKIDRKSVDAFHAKAMRAGGRDNGKPGLRADYGDNYYAAFAIDPDGYRVEAYCGRSAA